MKRRVRNRGLLDFPLRKVVSSGICQHGGNKVTKPELLRIKLACGHDMVVRSKLLRGRHPKAMRCEECGRKP